MVKCKVGLNNWCNGKDRKLVQLRTQAAGANGTNLYDGERVLMCAECRKANGGGFKIIRAETTPIIDVALLRPTDNGRARMITPAAKLLHFFALSRGKRRTTWTTICSMVCKVGDLKGTVEILTGCGYIKQLKDAWRLTDRGLEEARKIWPEL